MTLQTTDKERTVEDGLFVSAATNHHAMAARLQSLSRAPCFRANAGTAVLRGVVRTGATLLGQNENKKRCLLQVISPRLCAYVK